MIRLASRKDGIERRQRDRASDHRGAQPLVNFARPAHAANPGFEIRYYREQCPRCQAIFYFF